MADNQQIATIRSYLRDSLSPNSSIRKAAESGLESISSHPSFIVALLETVSIASMGSFSSENVAIRMAGSIFFKNLVTKSWRRFDHVISASNKAIIREHIIELMCKSTPDVQKVLSEAIVTIAVQDFPERWGNLSNQLIERLSMQDITMNRALLPTICDITKATFQTSSIGTEDAFDKPYFINTFDGILSQIAQFNSIALPQQPKEIAISIIETQDCIFQIYLLFAQYFIKSIDANFEFWVQECVRYLHLRDSMAVSPGVEDVHDTDDIDCSNANRIAILRLQATVLEYLAVLVSKLSDRFGEHQFSMLFATSLELNSEYSQLSTDSQDVNDINQYSQVIVQGIRFLKETLNSPRLQHYLFSKDAMSVILETIIIRNLGTTNYELNLLQDNEMEYIRNEIEESDFESIRYVANQLLKMLVLKSNENNSVLNFCVTYMQSTLRIAYESNGSWRAKDVSFRLLISLSPIFTKGASSSNQNIQSFLAQILFIIAQCVFQEITFANANLEHCFRDHIQLAITVNCLKIIGLFRHQFSVEQIAEIMQVLGTMLSKSALITDNSLRNNAIMLQCYVGFVLEKILSMKFNQMAQQTHRNNIIAMSSPLFGALFAVFTHDNRFYENEFVMKCLLKLLTFLSCESFDAFDNLLLHFSKIFDRIKRVSINYYFRHYLFECIAQTIQLRVAQRRVGMASYDLVVHRSVREALNSFSQLQMNELFLSTMKSHIHNEAIVRTQGTPSLQLLVADFNQIESCLLPAIQVVMLENVSDLQCYVLQILTQLIVLHRHDVPLSANFHGIVKYLLEQANPEVNNGLFNQKSSALAVADFLKAYISCMCGINSEHYLQGIVYLIKLFLEQSDFEGFGFSLLSSVLESIELSVFVVHFDALLSIMTQKMSSLTKSPRYDKLFLHYIAKFSVFYDPMMLIHSIERKCGETIGSLLERIFAVPITLDSLDRIFTCQEVEEIIVGLSRFLFEFGRHSFHDISMWNSFDISHRLICRFIARVNNINLKSLGISSKSMNDDNSDASDEDESQLESESEFESELVNNRSGRSDRSQSNVDGTHSTNSDIVYSKLIYASISGDCDSHIDIKMVSVFFCRMLQDLYVTLPDVKAKLFATDSNTFTLLQSICRLHGIA